MTTIKEKRSTCEPVQSRRPLLETNPYLRDPAKRRAMFMLTVISSSAVEGVRLTKADLADLVASS